MLKKASKVIIDSSGKGMSGVVPYMPLSDKEGTAKRSGAPKDAAQKQAQP